MKGIDLNCDMGESYGAYHIGKDEELLQYISSANIACGFHGGDPSIMRRTVKLCLEQEVAIGAHPGLPDLIGFGRRAMAITPREAYDMVLYQIGALSAFVVAEGGKLQHVKPHGALYHMTIEDEQIAQAVAQAIYSFDSELIVFGFSGSKLIQAGRQLGLRCANEAFADRAYLRNGSLMPRNQPGAVILDPDEAAGQALTLVRDQQVLSPSGELISIAADTLCIHGDGIHALSFAHKIVEVLEQVSISIKALR